MIDKKELQNLYQQGFSMQEIADRTDWSYRQVVYWMSRHNIPRRSRSDAAYIKRNGDGDPFEIKIDLTPEERELRGLGLGLYWGEGTKANKQAIRLGNTDPRLIKKFVEFLIKLFQIDTRRLRFGLQVFSDMNPEIALRFWMRELGVDRSQFQKKVVVTQSGKVGTYKNKTKHGVLTVYFSNTKLRAILGEMLEL